MNNSNISKLYINMTTKDPLCKQIIVSIGNNNLKKFLLLFSKYVVNFNCALKGIKLDVIIDFIRFDYRRLIIVSNKVVFSSVINNYVKNTNNLDFNDVQDTQLL